MLAKQLTARFGGDAHPRFVSLRIKTARLTPLDTACCRTAALAKHMSSQATSTERLLLASGTLLFLVGLIQGTAVHAFASPRLALSAHIAAVQNGVVLIVFALVWSRLRLTAGWTLFAAIALLLGMYAIWLSFFIAAVHGSATVFAFASKGAPASLVVDLLVKAVVYFGSGASLAGTLIVLLGILKLFPRQSGR